MIIFGTKAVTKTVETGLFNCPVCECDQPFERKTVARRGHLYFIPILPLGRKLPRQVDKAKVEIPASTPRRNMLGGILPNAS